MDLSKLTKLNKLREGYEIFKRNHPKIPLYFKQMSKVAIEEDTVVEITITPPGGKPYEANFKLKADEVAFFKDFMNI